MKQRERHEYENNKFAFCTLVVIYYSTAGTLCALSWFHEICVWVPSAKEWSWLFQAHSGWLQVNILITIQMMQDGWCRGVPGGQETLVLNDEVHFPCYQTFCTWHQEVSPEGQNWCLTLSSFNMILWYKEAMTAFFILSTASSWSFAVLTSGSTFDLIALP